MRHRRTVVGGDVPQDVGIAAAVAPPILAGEDGEHSRHGPRPVGRDRPDAGARVGAADEGRIGLPRQADVVHEPAPPGQKAVVFDACVRRTDMRHAVLPLHCGRRRPPQAG